MDWMYRERIFTGSGPLRAILIRDLHCHEQAQMGIARAVAKLCREYGFRRVLMEGADGPVRTVLFESFPIRTVRMSVGRRFLKEGYLTGAELAAIEMGPRKAPELYGLEESDAYLENLLAFRKVRRDSFRMKRRIRKLDSWVQGVKEQKLSRKLKMAEEVLAMLDEKNTDLNEMLAAVDEILNWGGVRPVSLATSHRAGASMPLKELIRLESRIDEASFEEENKELYHVLQMALSQKDLKRMAQSILMYRLGQSALEYVLQDLKDLYEKSGKPKGAFHERYPQIQIRLDLAQLLKHLDVSKTWNELRLQVQHARLILARSEGVEDLVLFDQQWRLFLKLVNLEIRPEELKSMGNPPFQLLAQIARLESRWPDVPVAPRPGDGMTALVNSALDFYELAMRRDGVMAGNALKALSRDSTPAVIITGGFHTGGIEAILQDHQISYETWVPRVTGSLSSQNYERRMSDLSYDLDQIEHSPERLVWRRMSRKGDQTLAAPVLLNDILAGLSKRFDEVKIRMLRDMVADLKTFRSINVVLDAWMGRSENINHLKALNRADVEILFQALDPGEVFLKLTDLDPLNKTQAELAIGAVKSAYGEKFPALVKLTRHYFEAMDAKGPSEAAVSDGRLYRGEETLDLLKMDYAQFRRFVRDLDALESAIKNDERLAAVSRFLISVRFQWRIARDILDLTPKFTEKLIEKPFAKALIFAFYNNLADLTDSPEIKGILLDKFREHCTRWLQGEDPADETHLLGDFYNADPGKVWTAAQLKAARAVAGNNPILFDEGPNSDGELMQALESLVKDGILTAVYVHPFTDEAQILGRKIPRRDREGLEYGYGEILRALDAARRNPEKKHVLLFKNVEAMDPGIRTALQEILRIREIRDPNLQAPVVLPENVQIMFTKRKGVDLEDDSFMDRVYFKAIQSQQEWDDAPVDFKPGSLEFNTIRVEKGRLILPGAEIELAEEFADLTSGNVEEELYRRLGLVLDEESAAMLAALEMTARSPGTILRVEGASGAGKTFAAQCYARLAGRGFAVNPVSRTTDLSEYIGGYEQDENGRFLFNEGTAVRRILEEGGVLALSELNTLLDDRDKASLAWWLQQLAEAKPDAEGYKTIHLSELPRPARQDRPLKEDRIRVHPGAVVVVDINPESDYAARGALPEIFKEKTRQFSIPEFIEKEGSDGEIRARNVSKIRRHLDFFLKFDWVEDDRTIVSGVKDPAVRKEIAGRAAELYNAFIQAYLEKQIGEREQVIFTKRELKRLAQDALYALNVLGKSPIEGLVDGLNRQWVVRWSHPEDRSRARDMVRRQTGIEPEEISMEEFVQDQVLKKARTVHVSLDPKTDLSPHLDELRWSNPGLVIKTIPATDETDRFMLEGGRVPDKKGVIRPAKGVLGRLMDDAAQAEDGGDVLYVIENAHNIDAHEIVALNELLQDRRLTIRGKFAGVLPPNAHIMFVSRQDSELAWSQAEKSRAVWFGHTPRDALDREFFLRRLRQTAPHWDAIREVLSALLGDFDLHYNELLKSHDFLSSRQSQARYRALLERVLAHAGRYGSDAFRTFFEAVESELKFFYFQGLPNEWTGPLWIRFHKEMGLLHERMEMILSSEGRLVNRDTPSFDEIKRLQEAIFSSSSREETEDLIAELRRLLDRAPPHSYWARKEERIDDLIRGDLIQVGLVRRTYAGLAKMGHSRLFRLGDGRPATITLRGSLVGLDPEDLEREPELLLNLGPIDVNSVVCVPLKDGRLAVTDGKGLIRLFDLERPDQQPQVLADYGTRIGALQVLDDGRVAAAGDGGRILVYDPSEPGPNPQTLGKYEGSVKVFCLLKDGRVVVSGTGGAITIFDPDEPGRDPVHLAKFPGGVAALGLVPDGRLAVAGGEGLVMLYDPAKPGDAPKRLGHYREWINTMDVLQDGRILVGGWEGDLKIFDPAMPGQRPILLVRYPGELNDVKTILTLPDGRVAVAWGDDIQMIEARPAGIMADDQTFVSITSGIRYAKDELPRTVALLMGAPVLTRENWQAGIRRLQRGVQNARDARDMHQKAELLRHVLRRDAELARWNPQPVSNVGLEPGSICQTTFVYETFPEGYMKAFHSFPPVKMISTTQDGQLRMYDAEDPDGNILTFTSFGDEISHVKTLTSGLVAAVGKGGDIKTYSLSVPEDTPSPLGHFTGVVHTLAGLKDGRFAAGGEGGVRLYNPKDPKSPPVEFLSGRDDIYAMAVLDGDRLIAAGKSGRIWILDPAQPLNPQIAGEYGASVRAFDLLDDHRIVAGGEGGRIKIFDLDQPGVEPLEAGHHVGGVHKLVALDGDRIAVAGEFGKVKIYSLSGRDKPIRLRHDGKNVKTMFTLPDGRLIVEETKEVVCLYELNPMGIIMDANRFLSVAGGRTYAAGSVGEEISRLEAALHHEDASTEKGISPASAPTRPGTLFTALYPGLPFYFGAGEDGFVYINYQGAWHATRHTLREGVSYNTLDVDPQTIHYEERWTGSAKEKKIKVLQLSDILHPWPDAAAAFVSPDAFALTLSREDFLMETDVLMEVESALLQAFHLGWGVDLEGGPGGGKTSIAREIALLLGLPVSVFQMHGQRTLSDWIGGFSEDSSGILRRNNIPDDEGRFRQELLDKISRGGVFVVDEGAIGKKGRDLLNWLSPLLRQRRPPRAITLHEFPGSEIPLAVHPDFFPVITNNIAGKTQAREVVKSEVASNVIFIHVPEDDGPETLKRLFVHYSKDWDIDTERKERFAQSVSLFHASLKERIGRDLGLDHPQRYFLSKREIRRTAGIIQGLGERTARMGADPLFEFYVALRVVYESMFSHHTEKHEVRKLIESRIEEFEPGSLPRLQERLATFSASVFRPEVHSRILTASQLHHAFAAKLSLESGQPVLLIPELGARSGDLAARIFEELDCDVEVIDADPHQTRTEILGGPFPDVRGGASKQIAFLPGKIVKHLMTRDGMKSLAASGRRPKPVAVWIRNIDQWSEDLRTALNGFLEDGFIRLETADGSMRTFYRPGHVYFLAEMGSDAGQGTSDAFFSRWTRLGVGAEDHTISESGGWPDFEAVLVKRYGLDVREARELARLYFCLKEMESAKSSKRWIEEQHYGISPSIFYALAEAVQMAKKENERILNLEMQSKESLYDEHRRLSQKILSEEILRILGVRFRPRDRRYFKKLVQEILGLKDLPSLDLRFQTTTGTPEGLVRRIGGVGVIPLDGAKSPLDVAPNHRVRYVGESALQGLSVLARASQLGRAVALTGEPGSLKTTLTAHFAEITGRAYYKFQGHKKARVEDLTIEVEQEADGTFVKNVKALYRRLRAGNVVIDIDEANAKPDILWMLEPLLRGEKRIHPIFPGEPPFEIGPGVQLVFTFNPSRFSGREDIDPRILDRMIVAWMEGPDDKDRPAIAETFYGVWFEPGGTQDRPIERRKVHIPPIEMPGKIGAIDYSHEKIRAGIRAFGESQVIQERVDLFLDTLAEYLPALANRDGAAYNGELLRMARDLNEALVAPLKFIQASYAAVSPDRAKLRYAILELRKHFIPFDRHLVVFMSSPRNRTVPFLHVFPNRILKRIRIPELGWEASGEALVVDGRGLEKGNFAGYFDGEFVLVNAAKCGGPDDIQTEWNAHHELGHVNDHAPGRFVPKNIEIHAMLSPLMHSRERRAYVRDVLEPNLDGDTDSYYTQAAKGILNALVMSRWDRDGADGFPPQMDDDFDAGDIQRVLDVVHSMAEEELRNLSFRIYDHPSYLASGNKGLYKLKMHPGAPALVEMMQGIDAQIEFEITAAPDEEEIIEVTVPEGRDEITDDLDAGLPDILNERWEKDLQRLRRQMEKIREQIEHEIEAGQDDYEKMILGGQGESEAVFGRLRRAFKARRKTQLVRMKSGLEIDPVAHMLKQAKRFIKRVETFDLEPQAVSVLMDFSKSLKPFQRQMGYAVRSVGDNFRALKETAPRQFFYDLSFYTDKAPLSVIEMDRFYSEQEWKNRCAAMGRKIGEGGNDLLKALREKLKDFVGPSVRADIRRLKNKTLILFTDGQDEAISRGRRPQPIPELKKVLEQYREAGIEIFAIGYGEGARPVAVFRGKGQHFVRIRADRPYDVADAVAKFMEKRAQNAGSLPDGDLTDYLDIGSDGSPQIGLTNPSKAVEALLHQSRPESLAMTIRNFSMILDQSAAPASRERVMGAAVRVIVERMQAKERSRDIMNEPPPIRRRETMRVRSGTSLRRLFETMA